MPIDVRCPCLALPWNALLPAQTVSHDAHFAIVHGVVCHFPSGPLHLVNRYDEFSTEPDPHQADRYFLRFQYWLGANRF